VGGQWESDVLMRRNISLALRPAAERRPMQCPWRRRVGSSAKILDGHLCTYMQWNKIRYTSLVLVLVDS
jgi:hypothetical protein